MVQSAMNDPALDGTGRLAALREWELRHGHTAREKNAESNNHIHTIYSFSPYSPSMAALLARDAGLCVAGSVDHDSIAAAAEMLSACAILGIGGCVGFEIRVSFKTGPGGNSGPFAARRLSSTDSAGCAYMTVQGIPGQSLKKAEGFLAPLRAERLKRSRAMTITANALLKEAGFSEIDFDADVLARSKFAEGGGITERHLLAAVAEKIILKYGKGMELIEGLKQKFGITVLPALITLLSTADNPHYLYDLLGCLKAEFLPQIYIEPDEKECIPAETATAFAQSIGGIPAYAYLGGVEDDYIEELFEELHRLNFKAVAYMPPRNTMEQLRTLRKLSASWGFMEISGVDINSSRQSFNCPLVLHNEFRHLLDSNWALIAHERLASVNERYGLFSGENPLASMELPKRIARYAGLGRRLDLNHPGESAVLLAAEIDKGV